MKINELTEERLKSMAYDELARIELAQNNVRLINQELARRAQKPIGEEQVEANADNAGADSGSEKTD